MTEQRNREHVERLGNEDSAIYRAPSPSSELLDLVRSAEDDARLALRKRTPAVPMLVPGETAAAHAEEFVDVGDEAVDAPPSLPPALVATPAAAFAAPRGAVSPPVALGSDATFASRSWSPAVGIAVMLALAVSALLVLAR